MIVVSNFSLIQIITDVLNDETQRKFIQVNLLCSVFTDKPKFRIDKEFVLHVIDLWWQNCMNTLYETISN